MLLGHPGITDVAAISMPDENLGVKVCVYVVPAEGEKLTLEYVTSFKKEKSVAVYKLPERLEIVDAIPRNPVGKVRKKELREDIQKKFDS